MKKPTKQKKKTAQARDNNTVRIAVFCINPSLFNRESFFIANIPSWTSQWKAVAEKHPELDIYIISTLPGLFLYDGQEKEDYGANLHVKIIEEASPAKAAEVIEAISPDIALPASSWTFSLDWMPLNDSLTADILRKKGIRTVSNTKDFSLACFDKHRTHILLEKLGFRTPDYIYVNHELYKADLKKCDASVNVYREYILSKISEMTFPVIIKPVTGLSSQGLRVVKSLEEARSFLDSRRNGSDRIIEEYMEGIQAGLEIHGGYGSYQLFPPMIFSVTNFGITSPRQSIKAGPLSSSKYRLDNLYSEMTRLAESLNFMGCIQVDLVFTGEEWYIIEINSRLSGMTSAYAAAFGTTVPEMLLRDSGIPMNKEADSRNTLMDAKLDLKPYGKMKPVISIKFPVKDSRTFKNVKELLYGGEKKAAAQDRDEVKKHISGITCFYDEEAEQEREKGYCEIILTARKKTEELVTVIKELESLSGNFSDHIFLREAENLLALL
ncbi:MAG: ATP-grasp domain-containing protein [Treponemataceae bacterium]|nr:ATP-grasp domain-containing protein [Treponemataceae bacterium]